MPELHPNIAILSQFDPAKVTETADVFAEDAVFHYFNPRLPELQGDYVGREGIQSFFRNMASLTNGTFKIAPVSITPAGDELVVVQSKNTMAIENRKIEVDVVVVWRIVNGKIAEVWDIPAVYGPQPALMQ